MSPFGHEGHTDWYVVLARTVTVPVFAGERARHWGEFPGLYPDIDRIQFGVQGEDYEQLTQWGWRPDRAGSCQCVVTPLSVATLIRVTEPLAGRSLELGPDAARW